MLSKIRPDDETDLTIHQLVDARLVGFDAIQHTLGEAVGRIAQKLDRLQQVVGHHRVVHV